MTEEEAIKKRNRLDSEIEKLQTAGKNIQPEEEKATAERKKISDAFGSVNKWKGNTYKTIEELGIMEKYYSWVNNIDTAEETIYSVRDTKQNAREAICSWYGY